MTRFRSMLFAVAACAVALASTHAQSRATVFEGARIIVGDGSAPIENGAFVVDGDRITQVARTAKELKAPAGAARVNLAGKTVMPGIIDTHVHIPDGREAMIDALRRKAYHG